MNRPLTDSELTLIRWLIEHGEPEAREFAAQLQNIRVVGGCGCGCPSIDLECEGLPASRNSPSEHEGAFSLPDIDTLVSWDSLRSL